MECVEKLIKKDMLHPLTNVKLREKDIIVLQRVSFHRWTCLTLPLTLLMKPK